MLSIRGLSALSTIEFCALAWTTSPDLSSSVRVMSVRIRPNDAALVTSLVTPPAVTVQRYSLCVCAEMITLILGSRRCAILSMSLPARLPAHPLRAGAPDCWPPWWTTSTHAATCFAFLS